MPGQSGKRTTRHVSRKLVVIGDGACGKTSLLNVFVRGHFPQAYEPTVFENHVATVSIEDTEVALSLWDTAGQEEFDRLRSLTYPDTHVILICFSVDSPVSLENVEAKVSSWTVDAPTCSLIAYLKQWLEEILTHCEGVKICLVALKCDLREDAETRNRLAARREAPVEYEEGLAVARRIRASRYLECSAKANRGVIEAFEEATRVAIGAKPKGLTRGSASNGDTEGNPCASWLSCWSTSDR